MRYKAHDYQEYATKFVVEHEQAGLILDMGLGKTVIVLTALKELILERYEVSKVLVIAPLRVARDTWPAEIDKWDHLKGLTYSVVVGTEKERKAALMKKAMIYIVNRENIVWLIENGYFDFDMLVIDELSSFKSGKTKRLRALKRVRGTVSRVVGLTGTPSPNSLLDLWSEIYLLDGGVRLGRFITHYRDAFFFPDKINRSGIVYSYAPKDGAEEDIYSRISDICISMKAADHLKMPDLVSVNTEVRMSDKEQKLYDKMEKDLILPYEDGDIDAGSAGELSNKLLQMASGAVYDENGKTKVIHDQKLDALEDLIEAANGQPVMVAYWYKHDRDRIMNRFDAVCLDSSESIAKWNKGEIQVALIHPASAGHGLNLQAGGHIMIWFSLTWSLELYQQTVARLYRQGQKETVIVQHIITKDTIDEDVLTALEKKDTSQRALLEAVKARIGGAR